VELLQGIGIPQVLLLDEVRHALECSCVSIDVIFVDVSRELSHEAPRIAARRWPEAPVVAMCTDSDVRCAFGLARVGYAALLELPTSAGRLSRCLAEVMAGTGSFGDLFGMLLGRMSLRDAQRLVRAVMLEGALSASNGSRRSAARMLGVTRPAVQRMLREADEMSELFGDYSPVRSPQGGQDS
jgi:DNA-binding NtrC family response regulator